MEEEEEEINLKDFNECLAGKKILKIIPTEGQEDESMDIVMEDGLILCVSNIAYIAEE